MLTKQLLGLITCISVFLILSPANAQNAEFSFPLIECSPVTVDYNSKYQISVLSNELEESNKAIAIIVVDGLPALTVIGSFREGSKFLHFSAKTRYTRLKIDHNIEYPEKSQLKLEDSRLNGAWRVIYEGRSECFTPQEESIGGHN